MPRPRDRFTVRPVHLEGAPTSVALPTILDRAALQVGAPVWVETRKGHWIQGTVTAVDSAVVHVRPLQPE